MNQAEKIAELFSAVIAREGRDEIISAGVNVHGVVEVHVSAAYFDEHFADRITGQQYHGNVNATQFNATTESGAIVFCLKYPHEVAA